MVTFQPEAVTAIELAGEPIEAKRTKAPGSGAAIGRLKVVSLNDWFEARPSGTKNRYTLFAECFNRPDYWQQIVEQTQNIISRTLASI